MQHAAAPSMQTRSDFYEPLLPHLFPALPPALSEAAEATAVGATLEPFWSVNVSGGGGRHDAAQNWTTCASAYDSVRAFGRAYGAAHGYVSIVVCIAGLAANIVSTAVLTRRRLWSPTNAILVSISASDLATIAVFLPYIAIFYAGVSGTPGSVRAHALFELAFAHIGLVAHTASVWLTVTLGLFRCLTVRAARRGSGAGGAGGGGGERRCCTFRRVGIAVACVAAASILIAAPQYATLHARQNRYGRWLVHNERPASDFVSSGDGGNGTAAATAAAAEAARRRDRFLYELQTWLVIVCVKLGPCLLLAILSGYLIHAMVTSGRALRRRRRLDRLLPLSDSSNGDGCNGNVSKSSGAGNAPLIAVATPALLSRAGGGGGGGAGVRAARRTTTMLVTVVVMFAAVGSPQALLLVLSVAIGEEFFQCAYLHLAELFDLLTIVNSSANFAIYCSTSKQFRDEFRALLRAAFRCCCSSQSSSRDGTGVHRHCGDDKCRRYGNEGGDGGGNRGDKGRSSGATGLSSDTSSSTLQAVLSPAPPQPSPAPP